MSTFEKLADLTQTFLTAESQMREMRDDIKNLREDVRKIIGDMHAVSERVTRLEAQREADLAQMKGEHAQFRAEVERAEMRLSRMLPPSQNN